MNALLLICAMVAIQDDPADRPVYESLSPATREDFTIKLFEIVYNENMQKELEIVPSQVDEIKQKAKQSMVAYRAIIDAAEAEFEQTKDGKKLNSVVGEANQKRLNELEAVLSDVLLPHQRQRLNQTVIWSIIRAQRYPRGFGIKPGFQSVLHNPLVHELLEVDERQAAKIQERTDELNAEFAREMTELYERFEDKLREELSPEQRKKAEQFIGETPEFLFSVLKEQR